MSIPSPELAERRRPRFTRVAAIYLYGGMLALAATALFVTSVRSAPPLAHPHLPWWAVAIGFTIAEACVVHIEFRRSAHSFSLADIPFVFGLVFASGPGFVIGALIGTTAVYALRRLVPVKLAFNVELLVHTPFTLSSAQRAGHDLDAVLTRRESILAGHA